MKSLAQGHEDNKRHKRVGEVCEYVLEAVVNQQRETNVLQAVPWDSETQSFRTFWTVQPLFQGREQRYFKRGWIPPRGLP